MDLPQSCTRREKIMDGMESFMFNIWDIIYFIFYFFPPLPFALCLPVKHWDLPRKADQCLRSGLCIPGFHVNEDGRDLFHYLTWSVFVTRQTILQCNHV